MWLARWAPNLQSLGMRGKRILWPFFREVKSAQASLFQPRISAQKIKENFRIPCAVQNWNSLLEKQGQ